MNHQTKSIRVLPQEMGFVHLILDMPEKSANVLSEGFLVELSAAIDRLEDSTSLAGVVIASAKLGSFVAGADIVAISQTSHWSHEQKVEFCRRGQQLLDRFSRLKCPVIAAIHGVCVGGGLELALACDARIASIDPKTLLGLPEVKLGLIPGWAGTVRLPRLIGLRSALELVTSGRLISATTACDLGMVDALADTDSLLVAATDLAREFSGNYHEKRERTRRAIPGLVPDSLRQLEAATALSIYANRQLDSKAPLAALRLMIDSAVDTFDVASAKEAETMAKLYGSEKSAGLIQAFFLNERAKKSGRFPGISPREIRTVGVAGVGVMGADIARICSLQTPTLIYDLDPSRSHAVADSCNSQSGGGPGVSVAEGIRDLAGCDLVIESIVEDVAAKRQLLQRIEAQLGSQAILTSNTSVISIAELAGSLTRPENFCGLHFCYPAQIRKLLEVGRGPQTSDETMATVSAWARSVDRIPLPMNDSPGFVINRMLCPMFNEVGHLLTQGCRLADIEDWIREYGFVSGPAEFMDAIGIDTLCAAGAYLIPRLTTPIEPSLLLHAINKAGWRGRKSGRGFYKYSSMESPPQANELLEPLIQQYAKSEGAALSARDVWLRLLMVMVNQAADALAEKVVADPEDVDLAFVHGAGFPETMGGPLSWARRQGLAQLVAEMKTWSTSPDTARRYRISPALLRMAESS